MTTTEVYRSSNGDSWLLCNEVNGAVFVRHVPSTASGGIVSNTSVDDFLTVSAGHPGPEHEALRELLGSEDD